MATPEDLKANAEYIRMAAWGLVPSYTKMEAKPGMNRYQYALTE